MAKNKVQFVCQSCGSVYAKWSGKCDACGEWNTIVEEVIAETPKGLTAKGKGRELDLVSFSGANEIVPRKKTGIAELDRALGGGLVEGSAILIGGDPGIGKSTLLLQAVGTLSESYSCFYISGEESVNQIRMRASRVGVPSDKAELCSANSVRDIIKTLDRNDCPDVAIIDSIQTMFVDNIDSAPGTVSQVRASASELIKVAKKRNIVLLIVGHVTKDGQIAGPRVLEHMVDTVLYFEGDRGHQFRILRAVKNRFGASDEIGVFEMADKGLLEVTNPSKLFLSDRDFNVPGTVVFAGVEGTRPMLVEVQALLSKSVYGNPVRAVVGWDKNRLSLILAVLESRAGIVVGANDVYLNVAGGLKISEPGADLSIAAAIISSAFSKPIDKDTIILGEVGLTGEVRPVSNLNSRLKEASKLGFKNAIIPSKSVKIVDKNIKIVEISHIRDLIPLFKNS
ncbi:MAG: DNA repair protein RadA [Alphaproteobacteria bacterium]|jgi:DNA repair protein RadA/Sms|nr:DNA repair protein RadA [Alphaproteobacteria bacterium]